ncbi:hypothetical protein CEV33_1905 [Brucella grignonensis]|uniref:Uncharacterized protein n=1 Tax=Brucella grignonensis TaxID=94627 RepID=A0A256F6H3_9HYPH|nr:hypothetical protein CEV33_1905 [Brucella grignonensis]
MVKRIAICRVVKSGISSRTCSSDKVLSNVSACKGFSSTGMFYRMPGNCFGPVSFNAVFTLQASDFISRDIAL